MSSSCIPKSCYRILEVEQFMSLIWPNKPVHNGERKRTVGLKNPDQEIPTKKRLSLQKTFFFLPLDFRSDFSFEKTNPDNRTDHNKYLYVYYNKIQYLRYCS